MKFVTMKDMKTVLIAVLFSLVSVSINAQMSPGVKFEKTVHDFGNIKEELGEVRAHFKFTNVSNHSIYITNVETSCGCTKPLYSKDSIKPGDTGRVTAIYETRGKNGVFHKNLYIYFNSKDIYQSLEIQGYVIPEANLSKRPAAYSTTYSNLAFTSTIATFKDLLNTQTKTTLLKAYNYMGYPIRIYEVGPLPDFVKVDIGDSVIDVNDSLIITFTVDGSKVGTIGESYHRIPFLTDDPNSEMKFLHVFTHLNEDFSKLSSKELKKSPAMSFDFKGVIDFGSKTAGAKVSKTITITNNGKSDLVIRTVDPSCSCITYKLAKTKLAPGESITMTITIDTVNQTLAEHTKYIKLYTNDPKQSEVSLKLKINITN